MCTAKWEAWLRKAIHHHGSNRVCHNTFECNKFIEVGRITNMAFEHYWLFFLAAATAARTFLLAIHASARCLCIHFFPINVNTACDHRAENRARHCPPAFIPAAAKQNIICAVTVFLRFVFLLFSGLLRVYGFMLHARAYAIHLHSRTNRCNDGEATEREWEREGIDEETNLPVYTRSSHN